MTTLAKEYKRLRASGWHASQALHSAKTLLEWEEADGYTYAEDGTTRKTPPCPPDVTDCFRGQYCREEGLVRLRIEPDEICDLDNLLGDGFDPKHNPDIPAAKLAKEREEYVEKIDRDGVWGIIGEYWDGEAWQVADSVWGFVGDDYRDSGWDTDIMRSTLDAFATLEHCPTCGRPKKGA